MTTGIQVTAPRAYFGMEPDQPYFLLRNDALLKRVILVRFEDVDPDKRKPRSRKAHLFIIGREQYEAGLVPHRPGVGPAIHPVAQPSTLPPWLSSLEGTVFDADDRWILASVPGRRRKRSPLDEVSQRIQVITPALRRVDEILSAEHPERLLNKIARDCNPAQNETRFRLWFFLYLAFGYRRWALLPPRQEWGGWDRLDQKYVESQLGRPALTPESDFRARTSREMIDKMVEGFRRYGPKTESMASAWAMTVRKAFKGQVERRGCSYVITSNGDGAPSYNRFYYHVHKELGKETVRRILYGETTIDYKEAPRVGPMWADLVNVGQRMHTDASHIKEHPRSYTGKFHLGKLVVAKLVDARTGAIFGVGFSLGSETARAYRYAQFCAAIPKSKFGEIIGLPIADEDWPMVGLADNTRSDNGPGSSQEARGPLHELGAGSSTIPSYDPKSNATVETKNSRSKNRLGAPTHSTSNLTPIEMIRREVLLVMKKNRNDDVRDRTPAPAVMEEVKSPIELCRYMLARHRTSLRQVPFDDAVRSFLDPVTFKVVGGRLRFQGQEYYSEQSVESGLAQFIRAKDGLELTAYVMLLVPRFAWIEFKSKLVEVRTVVDGYESFLSKPERDAVEHEKSRLNGERIRGARLDNVATQEQFKRETGKEWHSSSRRRGTFKLSEEARREMRQLNSLVDNKE